MIKFAICDNENFIRKEIIKSIENYKGLQCTIKEFSSGEELLNKKENFDVIFLDIDMVGINGIEAGRRIRGFDKEVKIIYVTSYSDYMSSAFSVHAFNYLVKPVEEGKIHKEIKDILTYKSEKEVEEVLEFFTTEAIIRLVASEIYYFEYLNRKINLKTKKGSFLIKEKIGVIAEKMEHYGFYIPHKSFTVNLGEIKGIKGYDVFMMDGTIIPLSQKKSTEFREVFNIFLEKRS